MKTILSLLAAFFLAVPAYAGDINLTTPIAAAPISKVRIGGFAIYDAMIEAVVAYVDSDGKVVSAQKVQLTDVCTGSTGTSKAECEAATPEHPAGVWNNYYSAAVNYTVKAGDVGVKASDLMEKQIRQEVKKLLNLTGTTP